VDDQGEIGLYFWLGDAKQALIYGGEAEGV